MSSSKDSTIPNCEYCTRNMGQSLTIDPNNPNVNIDVQAISSPRLIVRYTDEENGYASAITPIHYCPMCGKHLG